ncbi:MAG TPA: hypothetical protein VKI61_00445, partial [Chitinophagaceae bacterium]|nr:hypothetical protein [Chitinophagaceae bacterium]
MYNTRLNKTLNILILIIFVSFVWNLLVPGLMAYHNHVFFNKDVENKLPPSSRNSLQSFFIYKLRRENLKEGLAITDSTMNNILKSSKEFNKLENLIKLKEQYKLELSELKNPVTISGFFRNQAVYYTFFAYTFLGISIFLLFPINFKIIKWPGLLTPSFVVYIAWMFINWLRNFVFNDSDRTIFAFVNFDIDPSSFWLQELRIFGLSMMIVIVCKGWLIFYQDVCFKIITLDKEVNRFEKLSHFAFLVNQMFNRWQLNSVVICGAFLPWTFLYWSNIIELHDSRYIISALVLHVYWALTWFLTSFPLIIVFNKWTRLKVEAIDSTISDQTESSFLHTVNFIKEINPITYLQ